jgi:hypothetical protein
VAASDLLAISKHILDPDTTPPVVEIAGSTAALARPQSYTKPYNQEHISAVEVE